MSEYFIIIKELSLLASLCEVSLVEPSKVW